jgi:hypothetical protein
MDQDGGSLFENNMSIFIIVKFHEKVFNIFNKLKTDLSKNIDSKEPHFTIFDFNINIDHKYSSYFFEKEFHDFINSRYVKHFSDIEYTFINVVQLGPWHAFTFTPNDTSKITEFRTDFYKHLISKFGEPTPIKGKEIVDPETQKNIKSFTYNGEILFTIPDYNFGKDNWKAHVSIIKDQNVKNDKHLTSDKVRGLKILPSDINRLVLSQSKFIKQGDNKKFVVEDLKVFPLISRPLLKSTIILLNNKLSEYNFTNNIIHNSTNLKTTNKVKLSDIKHRLEFRNTIKEIMPINAPPIKKIKILQTFWDDTSNTDIVKMIKGPKYPNTLFIFNDNTSQYNNSTDEGGGNGKLRIYKVNGQRMDIPNEYKRAWGIPTGHFTSNVDAKQWTDRAINDIKKILRERQFDSVIFSGEISIENKKPVIENGKVKRGRKLNERYWILGSGIFAVNHDILKYITESIISLENLFIHDYLDKN